MSLILDALRKSEGQRQRHTGPGLASVPEAGERRGPPRWTLVLGALLVANAILILTLFFTRNGESTPPPAGTQARPAETAPVTPSQPSSLPPARTAQRVTLPAPTRADRQEVRPLAAEIPPASASTTTGSPPPATSAPRPQPVAAAAPPPAPRSASSTQASDDARLPRMSEMVVRGELNVPDMHVDIHVYSGNPAERFVFINMRKYKEGDDTREGPRIERITEAGVVMQYDGRRFVLPKD